MSGIRSARNFSPFFLETDPGTEMIFDNDGSYPGTLYYGQATYTPPDRQDPTSSPQWFDTIVVGDDPDYITRDDVQQRIIHEILDIQEVKAAYCTGSSRQVQLLILYKNDPTGPPVPVSDKVDVLVTDGCYGLDSNPPTHRANKLFATKTPIEDQTGDENLQRAWKTMTALSQALWNNYKP